MSIETLTSLILKQIEGITKRQHDFFCHLMRLWLTLPQRVNFLAMGRYGVFNEATYRCRFQMPFDFLSFNMLVAKRYTQEEGRIITFDPSYLPKSGRHTFGVGRFWSGCAGQVKKGLELSAFSCVCPQAKTAFHLYAQQTAPHEGGTLMDFYTRLLGEVGSRLVGLSKLLCVDAYFSKAGYVAQARKLGFTVISRLRGDAVLFFPYQGQKRKGRGRPQMYDGKVDLKALDFQRFEMFETNDGVRAYHQVLYVKSLKALCRVVIVPQTDRKGKALKPKIFFATDPALTGEQVLETYRLRFQCEFLYRDAKQAGLEHAQCRDRKKLHFHFNACLTAVSLAKVIHHSKEKKAEEAPFSIRSIKTQYYNQFLLELFISTFGIQTENEENSTKIRQLHAIGSIAA